MTKKVTINQNLKICHLKTIELVLIMIYVFFKRNIWEIFNVKIEKTEKEIVKL